MGILVSTINTSVDPNTITLLIVPALAAALLGGFTSFGITVAAGARDRHGLGSGAELEPAELVPAP